jgi:hypothetical protein
VKITAITATFERPQAMELCRKYMARQTRQPDQWIILDGPEPMIDKLLACIESGRIIGDAVIFYEDDDAFFPTWIEWCERMLDKYEMIGEGLAIYYNVRKRWWSQCANHTHASLCQTAIRRSLFETLCNVIRSHNCPWIDTQLWKIECDKMLVCPKTPADRRLIGIKGMPGKAGYSREHHKFDPRGCVRDPSMRKLFELLGPDAEAYRQFYEK